MFNKVTVDYYGTQTPVNQLASFTIPEPRMVVIQPFDKSSLAAIERAIRNSDLSVNPANDGNIIRIVLPDLTKSAAASTSKPHGPRPRTAASRSGTSGGTPRTP